MKGDYEGADMRVIAGTRRRLSLETLDSEETRPTTDRIKETLFNMLQFDVPGTRFLDLFAGSGGIGIEALSRDARFCTFCELNKKAAAVLERNIARTRFQEQSEILRGDYQICLQKLKSRGRQYDIVFMDPPYQQEMAVRAMQLMRESPIVSEDTLFIIEAEKSEDFSLLEQDGYEILREKIYKSNKHVFLRKQ